MLSHDALVSRTLVWVLSQLLDIVPTYVTLSSTACISKLSSQLALKSDTVVLTLSQSALVSSTLVYVLSHDALVSSTLVYTLLVARTVA